MNSQQRFPSRDVQAPTSALSGTWASGDDDGVLLYGQVYPEHARAAYEGAYESAYQAACSAAPADLEAAEEWACLAGALAAEEAG